MPIPSINYIARERAPSKKWSGQNLTGRTVGFGPGVCVCVCVCVCVRVCVCVSPPRLLITSGVMWPDMNSI